MNEQLAPATAPPSFWAGGGRVKLTVVGIPQPQGSKTRTSWGVRDDNPKTKPWQATVAAEAASVWGERELLTGPVRVQAHFIFPRPKSHFGTGRNASILKPAAPLWHTVKPDGDKLARAVGDALAGVVLRDDCVIAAWEIFKCYGQPARCEIWIRDLPDIARHSFAAEPVVST